LRGWVYCDTITVSFNTIHRKEPPADTLRYVRCEPSLARAIAQRDMAAAKLPKKMAWAEQAGNAAIAECAAETLAAWTFRVGELGGVGEVKAEVAPVKAKAPAKAAPAPVPVVRDCRVQAWRRFMAIAKSAGLDCQARERMTIALSKYLGVVIPSRSTLSSGQICEATEAVEMGVLAW
jgi:hypothetical protein